MADSYGAKLWVDADSDTGFGEIADVIEGDAAKLKMMFQRLKSLGQATRYTTARGNFIDGGSLSLKIVFTKAKLTTLKALLESPAPVPIRIEFPDDSNVTRFASDGKLVELGLPLGAEGGRLECDTVWEVSGSVTYTDSTTATTENP